MDTRTVTFKSYQNHAWLHRSFKRLSVTDLQFCLALLDQHQATSKDDFAKLVVRLHMDCPTKSKAWKEIEELLICANSVLP